MSLLGRIGDKIAQFLGAEIEPQPVAVMRLDEHSTDADFAQAWSLITQICGVAPTAPPAVKPRRVVKNRGDKAMVARAVYGDGTTYGGTRWEDRLAGQLDMPQRRVGLALARLHGEGLLLRSDGWMELTPAGIEYARRCAERPDAKRIVRRRTADVVAS